MVIENLSTLKIHKLTQAQYDRELAAGNIDENALYLTPEEDLDLSQYATTSQVDNSMAILYGNDAKNQSIRTIAMSVLEEQLLNGSW